MNPLARVTMIASMLLWHVSAAAADIDRGAAVLAAEDARFAAMVQADDAELGNWLAGDLQYVHSTGLVESRDQLLDSIGSGRFQVMTGDTRLDLQIRYLAVYGESGGRWRLRSWQSLQIAQSPGAGEGHGPQTGADPID